MSVRQLHPPPPATTPHRPTLAERLVHEEPLARAHALGRAYPIAKQLAEILELEDEALAADAKRLRQAIAVALVAVEAEVES